MLYILSISWTSHKWHSALVSVLPGLALRYKKFSTASFCSSGLLHNYRSTDYEFQICTTTCSNYKNWIVAWSLPLFACSFSVVLQSSIPNDFSNALYFWHHPPFVLIISLYNVFWKFIFRKLENLIYIFSIHIVWSTPWKL